MLTGDLWGFRNGKAHVPTVLTIGFELKVRDVELAENKTAEYETLKYFILSESPPGIVLLYSIINFLGRSFSSS